MRGLPSSIPLRGPRLSLLARRSVVPRRRGPTSHWRRRAAFFGSGATASSVRRCDGVARPAGRSGGPKGWERAGQALGPSFKSWSGVREPCAAGAPGRAPRCSVKLRSPWGLRTGRHGSVHVARLVKNGFYCAFARRPLRFLGRARREAYARAVPAIWLARPLCKNQEGDRHKAPRESA